MTLTTNQSETKNITKIEFIGEISFETAYQFAEVELGGLSGISYSPSEQIYYAISDDRSGRADARFYTLTIDLSDGQLDEGDINFQSLVTILDENGQPFPENGVDPEAIAHSNSNTVYITS